MKKIGEVFVRNESGTIFVAESYENENGNTITEYREALTSGNYPAPITEPIPQLNLPNWAQFKRIAMVSSTFTAITTAISPQSCAYLTTALIMSEMGEYAFFTWAWPEIVRQANVPPEVVSSFAGIAASCHLPADFVAALQPS
jgi:hypothetical protein